MPHPPTSTRVDEMDSSAGDGTRVGGGAGQQSSPQMRPMAGGSPQPQQQQTGATAPIDTLLNLQTKLVQLDNMLKTKGGQLSEPDKAKLNQFRANLINSAQQIAQSRGMTLTNALAAAAAASSQSRVASAGPMPAVAGGAPAGQNTNPIGKANAPQQEVNPNSAASRPNNGSVSVQPTQATTQGQPPASGSTQNPMLSQLAAMGPEYLKHVRLLIEKNRLLESQLQNTNLESAERERLLAQLAEVKKVQTALTSAMNRSGAAFGQKGQQPQQQQQQPPPQQAPAQNQSNLLSNLPAGLAGLSTSQIQQLLAQRQQNARQGPANGNVAAQQAGSETAAANAGANANFKPSGNAPMNIQLPAHIAVRMSGHNAAAAAASAGGQSTDLKGSDTDSRIANASLLQSNLPPNKKRKKSPPLVMSPSRKGSSGDIKSGGQSAVQAGTDFGLANTTADKMTGSQGTADSNGGTGHTGIPTLAALTTASSQTTPLMGSGSGHASTGAYSSQSVRSQHSRAMTPDIQPPQLARPTLTGGAANNDPYTHSPALFKPPMIFNGLSKDGQQSIGPVLDSSGAFSVNQFTNGSAVNAGNVGAARETVEERNQILVRKNIQDLVKSLGGQEKLDPQVEEVSGSEQYADNDLAD